MFIEMQSYFLQNFHKLYETINKEELTDDEIAHFEKLVRTYNINKNKKPKRLENSQLLRKT